MISLELSRIPSFLQAGSFYEALDTEEPQSVIQVPESCYVDHDEVNNITDFKKMINVMSFWGLHGIPLSLIVFCDENEQDIWNNVLVENQNFPFAQALARIFLPSASLEKAIDLEVTEAVEYLAQKQTGDISASVAAAKLGRLDYLVLFPIPGMKWLLLPPPPMDTLSA